MEVEEARVEYLTQLRRIADTNIHGVAGTLGMRNDAEQRLGLAAAVLRKHGYPGFAKIRARQRGLS